MKISVLGTLRVVYKKQMLSALKEILNLQKQFQIGNTDRLLLLEECQRLAIEAGEMMEQTMPAHVEPVHILEQYCEDIYILSQGAAITDDVIECLEQKINMVAEYIKTMPAVFKLVFMPYKASMWDSLESIWRAAAADKRCEAIVVPIPYYEFDKQKNELHYHYEGNDFPKDVPITDYREYALEEDHPDVIYIHNPYDDCNFVTSVPKRYFSRELKKYTDKLVYVPYYVTAGFTSPEHLQLPVYRNMDYMVVQSESYKESFQGLPHYTKILPLGSPKLDRVILMCAKKPQMPEEWQRVLGDKKILMLNTSVNSLLSERELYLSKIKNLFERIKQIEGIGLIWRPHPLFKSAIQSMRPELLEQFYELVSFFNEEKIGIWDDTPDITQTIAIADAYIGDLGTSVINLFGIAGKPIFILNNLITEEYPQEVARRVGIADLCKVNDTWWMTTGYGGIFTFDEDTFEVHLKARNSRQAKWCGIYFGLAEWEGRLYPAANVSEKLVSFDMKKKAFEEFSSSPKENPCLYRNVIAYEGSIFYIPSGSADILQYDTVTGEWKVHTECIEALKADVQGKIYETIFDCVQAGKYLWMTATYTNKVLRFDMKSGDYQIYSVGSREDTYSGIAVWEEFVWLAKVSDGAIVCWNRKEDSICEYGMPTDYRSWVYHNGRRLVHKKLWNTKKYLVTIPAYSEGMLKLDKKTGRIERVAPQFWLESADICNGYRPDRSDTAGFSMICGEDYIWVQRASDGALAMIHLETDEVRLGYPSLSQKDFEKLLEDQDGFEKIKRFSGFYRQESRIFSIEGFVKDLINGKLEHVKERQLNELQTVAANLDGSCGAKVHAYMMHVLMKE